MSGMDPISLAAMSDEMAKISRRTAYGERSPKRFREYKLLGGLAGAGAGALSGSALGALLRGATRGRANLPLGAYGAMLGGTAGVMSGKTVPRVAETARHSIMRPKRRYGEVGIRGGYG